LTKHGKDIRLLSMSLNSNIPIRTTDEVRQELARRGIAINEWAREMGFSPGLVHQVLAGRLRCTRGQSHKVAVMLGLKKGVIGDVKNLPLGKPELD